jgi:hypothetical protein
MQDTRVFVHIKQQEIPTGKNPRGRNDCAGYRKNSGPREILGKKSPEKFLKIPQWKK